MLADRFKWGPAEALALTWPDLEWWLARHERLVDEEREPLGPE